MFWSSSEVATQRYSQNLQLFFYECCMMIAKGVVIDQITTTANVVDSTNDVQSLNSAATDSDYDFYYG